MRSTPDLVASARIRDAAISVFARDGFARATVRDIAAEAGVSAPLVIHHYGSKAGLQRACDRHVLDTASREKALLLAQAGPDFATFLEEHPEVAAQLAYLTRALQEGGELADRWFDTLVRHTDDMLAAAPQGSVNEATDPEARNVVLVAQSLATLVFESQIARHLGAGDLRDPQAYARLGRAVLELHTRGLFTPAAGGVQDSERGEASGAGAIDRSRTHRSGSEATTATGERPDRGSKP